jgi:hypothetical protein
MTWWKSNKEVEWYKHIDAFNKKNEDWQKITRVEDFPESIDDRMMTQGTLIHFMKVLYTENKRLYNELKEKNV